MTDEDPLEALRREVTPPEGLKGRLTGDLRARGLLSSPAMGGAARPVPRRFAVRVALAAVAAIALLVAGILIGRGTAERGPADGPQFALLLYEPAGFDTTRSHRELAAEYGAWAGSLEAHFVGGEALGAQRVLGGSDATTGTAPPTGYFLLRAADWDEAMAIAAECPHLRHGGVVAVREIIAL